MSDAVIEQAWAFLRGHTRGELRFDENLRPLKYVITPEARPAAAVMVAMLQSLDAVLFVPDCSDGAMEIQVTLSQFDERGQDGAAADRWRIYHGEPDDVRWAFLDIDAARFDGLVIDGPALKRTNPLASAEASFCREINQSRSDDLRRICAHFGTMQIEKPVLVGIDPLGLDVRARFEVVRVPFPNPVTSIEEARGALASMRATAEAASGLS